MVSYLFVTAIIHKRNKRDKKMLVNQNQTYNL